VELTDNLNIKQFRPLTPPAVLKYRYAQSSAMAQFIRDARSSVQSILCGKDSRRIVIVGPCSLHDVKATLEYAGLLKALQKHVEDKLLLIMRTYFEKPRTVLGWKGMIYDPHLDGSYDIEQGLRRARSLLCEMAKMGLPTATEFLDPIVPQYLADLVTWAAIGARTAESQIHRQMASGLSMPIGFKNPTDGSLKPAVEAIKAAANPHAFLGVDREGHVVIAETRGNAYGHLVMRGGSNDTNFGPHHVTNAQVLLSNAGISTGVIIDCSHANSRKDFRLQRTVLQKVADQIQQGNKLITGVMLESFLNEGNQAFADHENLRYGVSLTDSCISWRDTEELIHYLAKI